MNRGVGLSSNWNMELFTLLTHPIPHISTEEMIEVDRLMIETYRIELIQMMENAGRGLALLAKQRFLSTELRGKEVIVLAGTGGNGGGAMVCARRLHSWGAEVSVYVTDTSKLTPIPSHQHQILQNMGVPLYPASALPASSEVDLIIDGIIGYSLSGNPHGAAAKMIHWANSQPAPVLSLDTPSGISLTLGEIFDPVVVAKATLTLALPKKGLFQTDVVSLRGELYLADISVPPQLYAAPSLGLTVPPIFAKGDILRLE